MDSEGTKYDVRPQNLEKGFVSRFGGIKQGREPTIEDEKVVDTDVTLDTNEFGAQSALFDQARPSVQEYYGRSQQSMSECNHASFQEHLN